MDPETFYRQSRVFIVAGKGGVGKSTVSAALAMAAARQGLSVLVVDLEGKAAIKGAFGLPGALGYEEEILYNGGLYNGGSGMVRARKITPDDALLEYLSDHGFHRISKRLVSSGALEVVSTAIPGIKDILVLGKIKQLERREMADLIIVDAPATGHAITFLTSASGLLTAARSGPIRTQAQEVVDFLSDGTRCRVMLVTIPEEMPVSETIEAAFQLEDRVGVTLGQVVVNECLAPLPPVDILSRENRSAFIKSLGKRYDMPPPMHKTIVPSSEIVEAMLSAAVFHESRRRQYIEQFEKLADELPLPKLELPYLFSPVQGVEELGLLADALIRGIERLPVSDGEASSQESYSQESYSQESDVSDRLGAQQASDDAISFRDALEEGSQIADVSSGGNISGKGASNKDVSNKGASRGSSGTFGKGSQIENAPAGKGIDELISGHSVLICCGSGGVGKTTTSASLALYGAMEGRKVCVVTIDPAKRLADALGIDTLTNTPVRVELKSLKVQSKGELWAMMLDPKATFDDLVNRYSPSGQQAERIMKNRIYKELTSALSGTQEYMAMEKLYELVEDGGYDLVVVDTPPTRNAIDFLEAPTRLVHFLEHRLFRILLMPTRMYLKAVSVATQALLRTISKVAGSEIVEDAVAFFQAFEGMEEGFRNRAEKMSVLIREPATGFVLVTTPRDDAVTEADWFAQKLEEMDIDIDALIVNRVSPDFDIAGKSFLTFEEMPNVKAVSSILASEDRLSMDYEKSYQGADDPDTLFDVFMRNFLIYKIISVHELSTYAHLASHLTGEDSWTDSSHAGNTTRYGAHSVCTVVKLPLMAGDVHDIRGLRDMALMIADG